MERAQTTHLLYVFDSLRSIRPLCQVFSCREANGPVSFSSRENMMDEITHYRARGLVTRLLVIEYCPRFRGRRTLVFGWLCVCLSDGRRKRNRGNESTWLQMSFGAVHIVHCKNFIYLDRSIRR